MIVTDLWAGKIAHISTCAIKSSYFLMYLEKAGVAQRYSSFWVTSRLAHLPSFWVQKVEAVELKKIQCLS